MTTLKIFEDGAAGYVAPSQTAINGIPGVTPIPPSALIQPAKAGPSLAHIADRVLNRPLFIHPIKAEVILHVLDGRIGVDGVTLEALGPEANRFIANRASASGMNVARDGVAVISIVGSLVNRGAWLGARSGMTSYEGISAQLRDAVGDKSVKAIVLDIDSPGGEATGMISLAEQIRAARAVKPVIAVVNDMAASAAYGIASSASEIVVSPTSVVGSIGVVLLHLDRSAELQTKGIKPTLIYAGAHKVDGNPFGPLPETVRADLQREIGAFYDKFLAVVEAGRGPRFAADAARATEARTYLGDEAVKLGLADRIATLDAVLNDLSNPPRRGLSQTKGPQMSENNAAPLADNAGYSEAQMSAAVAAARVEGAAQERARIGAIIRSEAASGREAQAIALALETDIAADAAAKVLDLSPKASSVASRAAALPEIGASAEQEKKADFGSMWAKQADKYNARFA